MIPNLEITENGLEKPNFFVAILWIRVDTQDGGKT